MHVMMHVVIGRREHEKGEVINDGTTRNMARTNRGDEDGKVPTMGRQSRAAIRCGRVMRAIGIL